LYSSRRQELDDRLSVTKGSFTLQAEPNWFGLENKPTLWNGSIHTARRT